MKLNVVMACLLMAVVSVATVFYLQPLIDGKLITPKCSEEETVTTWLNFYFDERTLDYLYVEEIEAYVDRSIQFSNKTLQNSCIPMERKKASIEFVDLSGYTIFDFSTANYALEQVLGEYIMASYEESPDQFYILVTPPLVTNESGEEGMVTLGSAWVDIKPQFVVMDLRFSDNVLEHELGHLAWAQHDIKTFDRQEKEELFPVRESIAMWDFPKLKSYAYGALCGDAGSVMSYEEKVLPIYSSPNITYQGEVCGNRKSADNARLLTEYARVLRDKVDARPW